VAAHFRGFPAGSLARYARHRPEATLVDELVDQHYSPFLAALERYGRTLPNFVQQEYGPAVPAASRPKGRGGRGSGLADFSNAGV